MHIYMYYNMYIVYIHICIRWQYIFIQTSIIEEDRILIFDKLLFSIFLDGNILELENTEKKLYPLSISDSLQ